MKKLNNNVNNIVPLRYLVHFACRGVYIYWAGNCVFVCLALASCSIYCSEYFGLSEH